MSSQADNIHETWTHTFSSPNFLASAEDGNGIIAGAAAAFAARSSCCCAPNDIHLDLAITRGGGLVGHQDLIRDSDELSGEDEEERRGEK